MAKEGGEGARHVDYVRFDIDDLREGPKPAMGSFQDKLSVIKAYIWDLAQLYCMRSQIPGNVMSDETRLAIGLFRRWTKPEKLELLAGMVKDIDEILLSAFRERMLHDAHKPEPREKEGPK